jgi:hypothetical protein
VPISAFTEVSKTVQPNGLATFQQLNSAMLQGVPFPGRTIGEGITFLQQKADEIMPQGMAYDFKGESRQFVQEGNTLAVTFAVALLLIYLVLAAQFESFRDPFIILIGLPATVFGALLVLFILGEINGVTIEGQGTPQRLPHRSVVIDHKYAHGDQCQPIYLDSSERRAARTANSLAAKWVSACRDRSGRGERP